MLLLHRGHFYVHSKAIDFNKWKGLFSLKEKSYFKRYDGLRRGRSVHGWFHQEDGEKLNFDNL